MTKEVVRSDEHRAIGGILSVVSPFLKPKKHERGILHIGMSELQEKVLDEELLMTRMHEISELVGHDGVARIMQLEAPFPG
jgi:hypothetical protein